jgi:hypothetical protein
MTEKNLAQGCSLVRKNIALKELITYSVYRIIVYVSSLFKKIQNK